MAKKARKPKMKAKHPEVVKKPHDPPPPSPELTNELDKRAYELARQKTRMWQARLRAKIDQQRALIAGLEESWSSTVRRDSALAFAGSLLRELEGEIEKL